MIITDFIDWVKWITHLLKDYILRKLEEPYHYRNMYSDPNTFSFIDNAGRYTKRVYRYRDPKSMMCHKNIKTLYNFETNTERIISENEENLKDWIFSFTTINSLNSRVIVSRCILHFLVITIKDIIDEFFKELLAKGDIWNCPFDMSHPCYEKAIGTIKEKLQLTTKIIWKTLIEYRFVDIFDLYTEYKKPPKYAYFNSIKIFFTRLLNPADCDDINNKITKIPDLVIEGITGNVYDYYDMKHGNLDEYMFEYVPMDTAIFISPASVVEAHGDSVVYSVDNHYFGKGVSTSIGHFMFEMEDIFWKHMLTITDTGIPRYEWALYQHPDIDEETGELIFPYIHRN